MATTSISGLQLEVELSGAFEGIAPQPVTSFATSSTLPCDIFINHRGPDVKHTLANTLYHTLQGTGLRVFLDVEEIEPGDFLPTTIEEAMRSASLHIAIFSKKYAESPWCLAELSFMLKTGKQIVPIFYHVTPMDLRWVTKGKGIFIDAFSEHEQKGRYSRDKLDQWKLALHTVSFYSGEIINNNDDERKLLKSILNRVLKLMNKVPLVVAKYPIGLEESVNDFKVSTLDSSQGQKVQIVGIWGMGGSGKTTLAKEIYNREYSSMERFSFVFDVRDAAAKSVLHNKQIKLLEDLGVKGVTFDNIEQGKAILASRLRSVRVLIVLDDVDHIDQLEALLPAKDNLGWGSLVIVTTRDMEVLRLWDISPIYKMRTLNLLHAQQLFCWHAFLQPSPPEGFKDLVAKFLHVCNGLPLSLKVIGGQLYGNSNKDYWESQLQKNSRILPNCITERLKVSYDALDEEEKHIFLETACFFSGREKNSAITVWNRLGQSGLHSWETLVNKSLVEVDEDNYIRMHDHLRDLGREIAYQQSPYTLCFPQQFINAEKQAEKGRMIGGIIATTAAPTSQVDDFPVSSQISSPEKIGVNNGLMGDNLPPANEVVTLMQNNNIGKLRIYKAEPPVLRAFANSGIDIILGVANFELENLSSNQELANKWVDDNVLAYYPATNIKYIVVGNQALEKADYGQYVLPAMNNLQTSLQNANLQHKIKVSTTHGRAVIPMSFLPSRGAFKDGVKDKMRSVLQFLDHHSSPYMANIYPYFGYLENVNISLDYALFKSTSPVVRDGDRIYTNLFDAMVDTIYSAMEALGFNNIPIVVTESGWPSYGTAEKALVATIDNAQTYNNNLVIVQCRDTQNTRKEHRDLHLCSFQ